MKTLSTVQGTQQVLKGWAPIRLTMCAICKHSPSVQLKYNNCSKINEITKHIGA